MEKDKKYPWKSTPEYKGMHKRLKLTKNESAHHWNYNLLKDVIILDKKIHRKLHRFLTLNENSLCFFLP